MFSSVQLLESVVTEIHLIIAYIVAVYISPLPVVTKMPASCSDCCILKICECLK